MISDEMFFTGVDEQGNEVEMQLIIGLKDKLTNKKYIVYTDATSDENGNLNLYVSNIDESENMVPIYNNLERERIGNFVDEVLDGNTNSIEYELFFLYDEDNNSGYNEDDNDENKDFEVIQFDNFSEDDDYEDFYDDGYNL